MTLALLTWLPTRAWADDLYADLDRDGVRDVISIQTGPRRGLVVWLSSSQSVFHLPTRLPISRIVAADIDGDGGIDLVAADTSAKIHVWHRSKHGTLRRTHPRHIPPTAGPAHGRGLQESPETPVPAVAGNGPADAPFDAPHPAHQTPLTLGIRCASAADPAAASAALSQLQPRAPPAAL